MTDFADGAIRAYVGPRELGAEHNLEEIIVEFIKEARDTLDVAVQEIDSEAITQALIDASWGGISVRVFLEQSYVFTDRPPEHRNGDGNGGDPALGRWDRCVVPKPGETPEQARRRTQWEDALDAKRIPNRRLLSALLHNGVDVKADYNHNHIFHQKFIVRDNRKRSRRSPDRRPALLTGSTNFTITCTHHNFNHAIIFEGEEVSRLYRDEFEELRSGRYGVEGGSGEPNPEAIMLNGIPVQVLFAPDNLPELEIVKQILKCRDRMDFAIFTFAGSSAVDDAMLAALRTGVRIRGVFDPAQAQQSWAALHGFDPEDMELYRPKRDREGVFNKLHHKLMVIDDAIVIAGSMNYTAPGSAYNDENVFILGSPYETVHGRTVDQEECKRLAMFFRAEIDRIITQRSKRYIPAPREDIQPQPAGPNP